MKLNKLNSGMLKKTPWAAYLLAVFMSLAVSVSRADQNMITLDSANKAYSTGNYDKAITLYESIINKGVEASEIYFNLGNAYYKKNTLGLAILNYERAKKLNPTDEDINANLKLANQKTEDKIETAPQLFLAEWKNELIDLMSEKNWSVLCIMLVIAALVLLGIYISSGKRTLRQIGFFSGIFMLFSAILVFFIAKQKYNLSKNSNEAIITSASVTITGSPSEKGTKLFILHEGTKVHITQETDNWIEIKIANGNVGWIKTADLQKI